MFIKSIKNKENGRRRKNLCTTRDAGPIQNCSMIYSVSCDESYTVLRNCILTFNLLYSVCSGKYCLSLCANTRITWIIVSVNNGVMLSQTEDGSKLNTDTHSLWENVAKQGVYTLIWHHLPLLFTAKESSLFQSERSLSFTMSSHTSLIPLDSSQGLSLTSRWINYVHM